MKKSCFILLAALALTGCSDKDGGPEKTGKSVWEKSHAAYMLLNGNVATVTEEIVDDSNPEDPFRLTVLQAEFNPAGQLTFYNPISGYDPRDVEPAPEAFRNTRLGDWGVASNAWSYTYDSQGRMNHVLEYELGEVGTKEYTIGYGSHQLYVPGPFGVMDKPLWLLQGVSSIHGPNGFVLTCDGQQVTVDYTISFIGTVHEVYTYKGKYPVRCVSENTFRGELTTLTTDYTWGSDGRLSRTSAKNKEADAVTVTEYSSRMPYGPVKKSLTTAESLVWEVAWDYHTDGQTAAARFVYGQNFEIEPYTRSYSSPDAHGNWLRSEKSIDGSAYQYVRTITYR